MARCASRLGGGETACRARVFAAQQIQAETTTQITLRYVPNVDHTMWVQFGEQILEILSVINPNALNQQPFSGEVKGKYEGSVSIKPAGRDYLLPV